MTYYYSIPSTTVIIITYIIIIIIISLFMLPHLVESTVLENLLLLSIDYLWACTSYFLRFFVYSYFVFGELKRVELFQC